MSSESVLIRLRETFIDTCSVNQKTGEKFNDSTIDGWLRDSLHEHDVSLGGDFSLLPQTQEGLVLLLAQIRLCEARAMFFSNQADTLRRGDHQFGTSSSIAAKSNLALIPQLRMRYSMLKEQLISQGDFTADKIHQSKLFRKDERTDTVTETSASLIEQPFLIADTPVLNGSTYDVILTWTASTSPSFYEYLVYQSQNAGIFEKWNYNQGSTIEFINDSASRIADIQNSTVNAVKVTGLLAANTYYFLVVTASTLKRYAYSNEVTVTTP